MWKQVPRLQAEQIFQIEIPTIGDILEITVIEPFPGAVSAGKSFPTLYPLDSRLTLDIVAGTKRLFDIFSGGAFPLCYLVAIGYADPDIAARRFRDYTPTKADLPAGLNQPLPFGTGGAASYLDTLCVEIIPHLERQYPLDPRERVLIGYSLSGRFATFTLFSEPQAFGRYLIISPSLWWDRGSAFAEEEAWARSNADLPAKVLLVGGEAEETPGGGWRNNLDPRERVLIGYSLSGRFATFTLFSEPQAFGRYLIISPSLWWDRGSAFAEEEAWARSNADLPAKVLLVGGEAEETPGGGWRNN